MKWILVLYFSLTWYSQDIIISTWNQTKILLSYFTLFIFDSLFESHVVGRQDEEGIIEEAVKKKSGRGQMVEKQVMKMGFYLASDGSHCRFMEGEVPWLD